MVQEKINIPIIHIATATADEIINNNIKKIALLGTKYTMTQDFYKQKLIDRNIEVIVPNAEDIEIVNNIIYNELCLGIIDKNSKEEYIKIINKLYEKGAEGVILGCTEIGLLIEDKDINIPVFDTAYIHAKKLANLAI